MIVPTSEKLIFFGGGDPGSDPGVEFKENSFPRLLLWLLASGVSLSSSSEDPGAEFKEDRFPRWLRSARVSSSSSSSSSSEDVITIASAGFDFGAAGLILILL